MLDFLSGRRGDKSQVRTLHRARLVRQVAEVNPGFFVVWPAALLVFFCCSWYNQARLEERRKPLVNNGCRRRQLSRGLQRILFFACEGDLSRKSGSSDNQQPRAEQLE